MTSCVTGWYEHDGEFWPEFADPEDLVEFEREDGTRGQERVVHLWDRKEWKWVDKGRDIVRYRVVP